jgi:hypothetical protein
MILQNMLSIHVANKITTLFQKTKRKNIGKPQSFHPLNFGRHLGHHLEPNKKLFFDEICSTKAQAQIKSQNVKKFKTH